MNTLLLSSLLSFIVWCLPIVLAMLLVLLYREPTKEVRGLRTIYAAFMFTFVAQSIKFFQFLIEQTYVPAYDIIGQVMLLIGIGCAFYSLNSAAIDVPALFRRTWLAGLWIAAIVGIAVSYVIAPFGIGAMIGTAMYALAGLGMATFYLTMMKVIQEKGEPDLPDFSKHFYGAALLMLVDPVLRFIVFSNEMAMNQLMVFRTIAFVVATGAVLILLRIFWRISRHISWSEIALRINMITFFDENVTRRVMGIIMMTSLMLTTLFVFFLYMSHNQVQKVVKRQIVEDMQAVTRISARSLEHMVSAVSTDVQDLAKEFSTGRIGLEAFRDKFNHLYREYQGDVRFVSLVSADGHLKYTYPEHPSSLGKDLTYQGYLRDFLQDPKPGISPPFTTVEGPKAINIYAPVWHTDSTFAGMVAMLLDIHAIERRLHQAELSQMKGLLRVVAEDGSIIGSSSPGETGENLWKLRKKYNPDDTGIEELIARHNSVMFHRKDGPVVLEYRSAILDTNQQAVEKIAVVHPMQVRGVNWDLMYVILENSIKQKIRNATAHQWYIWGFMLLILAVTSAVLILVSIKWGSDLNQTIERTTKELRRTELRYRQLIEQSNDAIYQLQGTRFIYINDKFQELYGYSLEELNEPTFEFNDLYSQESLEYIRERSKKIGQGESVPERYEFTGMTKTGEEIHLEVNISYIETDEGVLTQGILRDITDRKESERALRESEATYRGLFNSFDDAIYIQDEQGRFLDVSEGAVRMYGYSKEEMIGQTPEMLAAPGKNNMAFAFDAIEKAFRGEPQLFEWWGQRKNGEVFPKEVQLNRATHFGKEVVVAIARDVSERKQLQQQLFQAQKMDSIGTLAGGIAHDFNNLLTGILGYTTLLKSSLDEDDPQRKYANTIEESGNRAAELTEQLLAFGRGGKYQIEPASANAIIKDVVNLLERTIDKSIDIRTNLSSHDPVFEVDASQMHQAIMNLCLNARDAMPEGGTLTITTRVRQSSEITIVSGDDTESFVEIIVSDTGEGMDEKVIQKIFEPFYTTKDKGEGTGLGLAMVYGIITNHNGIIDVDSEPEKGTTFRLLLPLSNKEPAPKPEEDMFDASKLRGEGAILIVDDEKVTRNLLRDSLEAIGYRVISAHNGKEGVEKFREYQSDIRLVILDMIMPVMNGEEAFYEIRALDNSVKIIVATGYSQHQKAREILKNDGTRFMQKPFKISELLRTIHSLLDDVANS